MRRKNHTVLELIYSKILRVNSNMFLLPSILPIFLYIYPRINTFFNLSANENFGFGLARFGNVILSLLLNKYDIYRS